MADEILNTELDSAADFIFFKNLIKKIPQQEVYIFFDCVESELKIK